MMNYRAILVLALTADHLLSSRRAQAAQHARHAHCPLNDNEFRMAQRWQTRQDSRGEHAWTKRAEKGGGDYKGV
jgi:hypothetical protein